jgi:galactokinase
VFQAPGRINVIGEHTDYSGGLAMPAAIDRRCYVAARAVPGRRLHVVAKTLGAEAEVDLGGLRPKGDWIDYVAGVAQVLAEAGAPAPGAELWIESEVPLGAGVSSSAALEVAVAYALLALAERSADPIQIARWAQAAENQFVGMPCGVMDQFASANGVQDCVLQLDCSTLEAKAVPLPPEAAFLIIDSMIRHAHAEGDYARRRAECEAAAAGLGLSRLSQGRLEDLDRRGGDLSPVLLRRARHVVTENDRVRQAADALGRGDLARLGGLLNRSHASLRDDMEVSVPPVDALVDRVQSIPAVLGARMMGGGFGGCVIALIKARDAEDVLHQVRGAYGPMAGRTPDAFACRAVGGAGEAVLRDTSEAEPAHDHP